jgi:ZIP family zinc transporter
MLTLFLAGTATALATGLGALPVFWLGRRAEALQPVLIGLAAGVMTVASVVGLLLPALDDGSVLEVAAGLTAGVLFLFAAKRALRAKHVHFLGRSGAGVRSAALVFAVLFVHSLPEGLAIGTAYASDRAGLSLFVILAIAIQNIPEGTSVAIPMEKAGYSHRKQFWAAVATSSPQPFGALLAYALVEHINGLLPVSFAFAAGAMLALVAAELVPSAVREGGWGRAGAGALMGTAVMLVLTILLSP